VDRGNIGSLGRLHFSRSMVSEQFAVFCSRPSRR
jgi:hypothetical protein